LHRTPDEIKKDMLDRISNTEDKTENSLIHDAIAPASLEIFTTYRALENAKNKLDIEYLEDEELEKYTYQRTGIKRKQATHATTTVMMYGEPGSVISEGMIVSAGEINFIIKENKVIGQEGHLNIKAECEIPGSVGNVPEGAINDFTVAIEGIVSVNNEKSVTNGYDEETDESLLERYYERVITPATSGNKHHYLSWAKEVEGVGDAKVISLWNGPNTVKIIIIDSNKKAPDLSLIGKTQTYIDPNSKGLGEGKAPIGAFCTVVSAVNKSIDVSFTIVRDNKYTHEQVKTNTSNNITEYLKTIAFKENLVSYARIGAAILASEGVLDYSNLNINLGTANISINNNEVAILGTVVINE